MEIDLSGSGANPAGYCCWRNTHTVSVYVRRSSRDLSVIEIVMARHGGLGQEELDAENDETERYPLGPKECWRAKMVGEYTMGPEGRPARRGRLPIASADAGVFRCGRGKQTTIGAPMTSASGTDDGPLQRPDSLVAQLPRASPLNEERHKSSLYSYFGDSERFVVVVGEKVQKADWALVYGLSERAGRRLHLLLPASKAFATQQRVPWLTDAARPEIWVHESGHVEPSPAVSRAETIQRVRDWAHERSSETTTPGPMAELAKASTPAHLGPDGHRVAALAEWATSHPQLDASHRQGERAWHCAGQKVLSFKRNAGLDITIRAGIHDTKRTSSPDLILRAGTALSPTQLAALQAGVLNGVQDRLLGRRRKPDEHWLQSVLRRHPSMVGIEAPALREVPAWRPTGAGRTFGRGFLDLLGLDGQGDIRIVEAKLAKSNDDGVLLQGLDYYVWASAYIDALRQRLSAPAQAELRLHYAVGIAPADQQVLPPRAYRYASAIDTGAVPFRFHLVRGWETLAPDEHAALQPQKWAESSLPYAGGKPPSA